MMLIDQLPRNSLSAWCLPLEGDLLIDNGSQYQIGTLVEGAGWGNSAVVF